MRRRGHRHVAQAVRAPGRAAFPQHRLFLAPRQSILVTGGTGFIGARLCEILIEEGHQVTVLTRDPRNGRRFRGRVTLIDNLATLGRDTRFDAIVNLAGEPVVAGRWTAQRRRALIDSRLATTPAVVRLIARSRRKPAVLVSGAAVGFYRSGHGARVTGESPGLATFPHGICASL